TWRCRSSHRPTRRRPTRGRSSPRSPVSERETMIRSPPFPRPPVLTGIALAVQLAFAHPAASAPPIAPGTLPTLLTGGRLQGATVAAPVPIASGQQLNINQSAQRAYIDWSTFNIAGGSVVNFQQPSSTASVLNNIFQGTPSVIQGQLQANGIVYLINQNGILFDKGSQVKVGGLVASALGLNPVNGQTFFDSASAFPSGQPVFAGYGNDPDGK